MKEKLFLLCLLLAAFVACTQDVYDKGDGKYSQMMADLCVVRTDHDKAVHYALTDEGDSLSFVLPYTANWLSTPDSTYRTLLYYNLPVGSGSNVEAVSMTRVPTASIHTPDYFKSGIKTDPILFESLWIGKSRRYLNIGMYLMTGSTTEKETHRLGVVADTLLANPDSTRTLYLRLYHDQGGVPEYYSQRAYFSIPIGGITADSIAMTINTYEGTVEKRIGLAQP